MNPKDEWCSFCYMPGVWYKGGLNHEGVIVEGQFCTEKCFKLWARWKAALINWELGNHDL
jgi:hypothetical protein